MYEIDEKKLEQGLHELLKENINHLEKLMNEIKQKGGKGDDLDLVWYESILEQHDLFRRIAIKKKISIKDIKEYSRRFKELNKGRK